MALEVAATAILDVVGTTIGALTGEYTTEAGGKPSVSLNGSGASKSELG